MARKYEVRWSVDLDTPSSADEQVVNEQIDLALLLSKRLQKNIRQGRSFRLHSVKASLASAGGNHDIGVAFSGTVAWCPATKNSVKAWQHAFKVWQRQKQLALNATGSMIRYDDFEVAFGSPTITNRTSTLYAEGLTDSDTEFVTLYGVSNDGIGTYFVSLEDIYESAHLANMLAPSRFPLSNASVKETKFQNTFPDPQGASIGAHYSAGTNDPSFDSAAI